MRKYTITSTSEDEDVQHDIGLLGSVKMEEVAAGITVEIIALVYDDGEHVFMTGRESGTPIIASGEQMRYFLKVVDKCYEEWVQDE